MVICMLSYLKSHDMQVNIFLYFVFYISMYFTTCIGIEDNCIFSYIVLLILASKSYFLSNNLDLIFLSVMCKSKAKLLLIYY